MSRLSRTSKRAMPVATRCAGLGTPAGAPPPSPATTLAPTSQSSLAFPHYAVPFPHANLRRVQGRGSKSTQSPPVVVSHGSSEDACEDQHVSLGVGSHSTCAAAYHRKGSVGTSAGTPNMPLRRPCTRCGVLHTVGISCTCWPTPELV